APLPAGADAVVMVEKTETLAHGRVKIDDPGLIAGQHVIPRGKEMRAGEVVVPVATVLTPAAVGLLAAAGRGAVRTFPSRRVHVPPLAEPLTTANDRPTYHPAKLTADFRLTPLPWFGSADLRALLAADALLVLPAGQVSLASGSSVDVIVL